jgi:N-acyl-D-aspartate/D-glutamate deacylase
MLASDGFDIKRGSGHPRSAGPNLRVLGRYVRERAALSLMRALRRMTPVRAQRIEAR